MESYKVLFKGQIIEEKNKDKLGVLLARFLNMQESETEQLFNGKSYALKKNLELDKAEQIQSKLASQGIITNIVKETVIHEDVSIQENISTTLAPIFNDREKKDSENWFNKALFKVMGFLGLTSGVGIVGIGGYWFIYSLLQYIVTSPQNVMQQSITENYFNQAQMGLLIAAIGVLIMEIKKLKVTKA